jgi:dGTPase
LDRQMRRFGDRFDHNLHALRIVESFEHRYARFPGLNLTFEVREGIVKHSRDFTPGEDPSLDEYSPGLRPPVEAQLIDLADELAYNTADLDDAFSAGLFGTQKVCEAVPEFARLCGEVEGQFPGISDRERFQEVLRGLVNSLVSGLIDGTIQAVEAAAVTDFEQVRAHPRRLASFTPEASATNRALKQFLHHTVYYSSPMTEERRLSAAKIAELFEFYVTHPDGLPENYAASFADSPVHRVVCDYIAGMTDGYFLRCYEQALG